MRLAVPYKYRRLSFRAFANPSGVNELDPNLTINGTTKTPVFRYKGGDADGTNIDPWTYGEILTLRAGAVPTYNDGSPGLGVNDDSVKFNGGGYYKNDTAVNQIGTEDFAIEIVWKSPNLSEVMIATRVADGYAVSCGELGTGNVFLRMDAFGGGLVDVPSATSSAPKGTWNHALIFVNRDEASANGSQWYINGVASGAGVDVSGVPESLISSAFTLGANTNGTSACTENLAYCAMWKHAAWMQAGAAGPAEWAAIAAERFAKFNGVAYANKANGTALARLKTRDYPAYIDKIESGVRKLYYVSPKWMRMCSRDDSNAENVKGYLSEPEIENLFDESEDFSAWTKIDAGDTVTDDAAVCPDGRTAAASLVADNTEGQHGVYKNVTLTADTYAFPIFAKPGNYDWIYLRDDGVANATCFFDIANGIVGTAGAGAVGYIEGPFWGGFYRCCIVLTGTAVPQNLIVYTAEADGDATFAGDGVTVNTYLWGAQCEKNDYMTSPIRTNGATATRLKDQLRYVGDDGNITNNQRGTLACDVLYPDYDSARTGAFVDISDGGAAADRILINASSGDIASAQTAATEGNPGVVSVAGDIVDGIKRGIRLRWATNNLIVSRDGVDGAADTACDIPNDLDRVDVGMNRSAILQPACLIQNLRIYSEPKRRG